MDNKLNRNRLNYRKLLANHSSMTFNARIGRFLINAPKKRLIKKLQKQKKIERRITTTFYGTSMHVNLPELVSQSIFYYGFYEPSTTRALIEMLEEGQNFVDIGAHIGYYSLLASNIVGSNGAVHSFEPTPSTHETLLKNTTNEPNITVNNLALWFEKTKLDFHDFGIGNSVFNSFYSARSNSELSYDEIEVATDTLDNRFLSKGIIPDVIKIDAESAELEILKGGNGLLKKHRPKIIMEIGDFGNPDVPKSSEIIFFLESKGYIIYDFKKNKFVELVKQDSYPSMNIYCIKN